MVHDLGPYIVYCNYCILVHKGIKDINCPYVCRNVHCRLYSEFLLLLPHDAPYLQASSIHFSSTTMLSIHESIYTQFIYFLVCVCVYVVCGGNV